MPCPRWVVIPACSQRNLGLQEWMPAKYTRGMTILWLFHVSLRIPFAIELVVSIWEKPASPYSTTFKSIGD